MDGWIKILPKVMKDLWDLDTSRFSNRLKSEPEPICYLTLMMISFLYGQGVRLKSVNMPNIAKFKHFSVLSTLQGMYLAVHKSESCDCYRLLTCRHLTFVPDHVVTGADEKTRWSSSLFQFFLPASNLFCWISLLLHDQNGPKICTNVQFQRHKMQIKTWYSG